MKKGRTVKNSRVLEGPVSTWYKKANLIEALIGTFSPGSLVETNLKVVGLHFAQLELEKERIRQKAVQEAATLE